MYNKFFYLLFSFILIACSSNKTQQELPFDGKYYTIDLDGKRETSIPLSSIFKRVRTIILENSDSCLIGRLSDIQVYSDLIYILDSNKAKSLFVFDMEGKYVRKIGGIGGGPGEYRGLYDFTLDFENGVVYLCDAFNRIHKYQLDGTFLQTITIDASDSQATFIQYYNGRLYSSQLWLNKSKDNYMLLEIDPDNGKVLSSSLPVRYNKGWNEAFYSENRFFMSRANNPPRYTQMFMDYVVSIGEEITPYIKLTGRFLTTEEDIESFRGQDHIPVNVPNIMRSSKLFKMNFFVENDDIITFKYGHMSHFYVICHKKTGEVKLADYLSNDLVYRNDRKGSLIQFLFADAKGAYHVLDTQSGSDFFDNLKNAVKNDEIVPDLDKLEQLKQLDEESNPIVFFYEFK